MAAEPSSKLAIKVVPGSSRDAVAGWIGERLKVRVAAPPERGRANAAAERVVAEALGLAKERVRVVVGGSSAQKIVAIEGLAESVVFERLHKAPPAEASDGAGARSGARKERRS